MALSNRYTIHGYEFVFTAGQHVFFGEGNGVVVLPNTEMGKKFLPALKLALFLFVDFEEMVRITDGGENDLSPRNGIYYYPIQRDIPVKWKESHKLFCQFMDSAVRSQFEYQQEQLAKYKKRDKKTDYPGYVYLLKADNGTYKIGRAKDPANRQKTFGVQLPFDVEYVALIKTSNMVELETVLHDRYAHLNVRGEWFNLSDEDVACIKSLEV